MSNEKNLFAFGELLRGFRTRHGITQQELAQTIGVSRNTISAWERSDYLPENREVILRLEEGLHLSPPELDQLLYAVQRPPKEKTQDLPPPIALPSGYSTLVRALGASVFILLLITGGLHLYWYYWGCSSGSDLPAVQFEQAKKYTEMGNYRCAIVVYTHLIKIGYKREWARFGRGKAYYYSGDYDQAITDFEQLIEEDGLGWYDYVYYFRGLAYQAQENKVDAVKDFHKASENNTEMQKHPAYRSYMDPNLPDLICIQLQALGEKCMK